MFAYFEVYEPQHAEHNSASVTVSLRILDASTGQVKVALAPAKTEPNEQSGSSVLHIVREIPIGHLPPGTYRLEVRATDSAGETTAWRAASFTVE